MVSDVQCARSMTETYTEASNSLIGRRSRKLLLPIDE